MKQTDTGYIIKNGKVFIYPTLFTTRRECVFRHCGLTIKQFKKSFTHLNVVKVQIKEL